MKADSLIPTSLTTAEERMHKVSGLALEDLDHFEFIKAWFAVVYVFPGFHPDDWDSRDSALPKEFVQLATEAWRRAEADELPDELLYPSDAQWAGLCDQIKEPTAEEANRRREIHFLYPMPRGA